jgi:hypothetical protein
VDADYAQLRVESLIRRTELLREKTLPSGSRLPMDSPTFSTNEIPEPAVSLGYGSRVLVKSVRHLDDEPVTHVSVQKMFAKSRNELYKRLVSAFSSDCGCGCSGDCDGE